MTPAALACVHCAAPLRRPQPAGVCKPCRQLAWQAFRAEASTLGVIEYQRAFNRRMGTTAGVLALLAEQGTGVSS